MLTSTTLVILICAPCARAQDNDGFIMVKRDGEVTIFERWVQSFTDPDVKVREMKTEFYYRNSLEAGLQLLRNEKKAPEWRSHILEFRIYPQDSHQWFEYTYHDIPWPVSDHDHFVQYNVMKRTTRQALISFHSIDSAQHAPLQDGVTRISLRGSWSFEQVEHSRVKVVYRVTSVPSGIPRVFTDPVIRNSMMATIKNFVKLLEQP
jgi:hypothetical protein